MEQLKDQLGTDIWNRNRQEGQTISAPASTAAGNVAGSTDETQTCKENES